MEDYGDLRELVIDFGATGYLAFHDFNVLVIDNASDLPAPAGLLSKHPRVTHVQNKTNLGFAAA